MVSNPVMTVGILAYYCKECGTLHSTSEKCYARKKTNMVTRSAIVAVKLAVQGGPKEALAELNAALASLSLEERTTHKEGIEEVEAESHLSELRLEQ